MTETPEMRRKRLRRLAMQIACQLPDSERDALCALDYARELVTALEPPSDGRRVLALTGGHGPDGAA